MRLRSYIWDVRTFLRAHWWVSWVALPVAFFGVGVYVFAEPLFGRTFARTIAGYYLLVGGALVVLAALAQYVLERLRGDADHAIK